MQDPNPATVVTGADHDAATAHLLHFSQPGEHRTDKDKWNAILKQYRPFIRYYAGLYRLFLKPSNSTHARNELMHAVTCGFTIAHIHYVSSDDFARLVDQEVHQMVMGILGPECSFRDFIEVRQITMEEQRCKQRMPAEYFEMRPNHFERLRALQRYFLHSEVALHGPEDTSNESFTLEALVRAQLGEPDIDPTQLRALENWYLLP